MTESKTNGKVSEEFETVSYAPVKEKPNLKGDWLNILILVVLNILISFPKGLVVGFSIILQNRKLVNYADQALLSMALWPSWMKILWAPIVDTFYIQWIGKRKSWLIFFQFLLGMTLIYLSNNIDEWLPETGPSNLKMLMITIFITSLQSATLNIVVDGWSLTIVKKRNLNIISTIHTVGTVIGLSIGSIVFVLLVSEDFSVKYLRTTAGAGGLISIKRFLCYWGIFTVFVVILVGIFKKETDYSAKHDVIKLDILQSYQLLWEILKMPRIRVLSLALLTMRFGLAPMENIVLDLKLIDAGVPKDNLMIMNSVISLVSLCTPFIASKYVTSSKPMSYCMKITRFKLLWSITNAAFIYYTPSLTRKINNDVDTPTYYYFILGSITSINEVTNMFMLINVIGLFYQLSDPRFGGTYTTLFNTLYFSGYLVSNTIVLKLINSLTFKTCSTDVNNNCSTTDLKNLCGTNKETCKVYVDGFYITVILCLVLGFVWYFVFRKTLKKYQTLGLSHWLVNIERFDNVKVNDNCRKLTDN